MQTLHRLISKNDSRRSFLCSIALFAFGAASASAADARNERERSKGIPTITVEELANQLRKEGFQWRFLGRQIIFNATVLTGGANPRLRIEGMDKDKFDTATIHNARPDAVLKPDEKVRVSGLIVDQWNGVWQVWCYEMKRGA